MSTIGSYISRHTRARFCIYTNTQNCTLRDTNSNSLHAVCVHGHSTAAQCTIETNSLHTQLRAQCLHFFSPPPLRLVEWPCCWETEYKNEVPLISVESCHWTLELFTCHWPMCPPYRATSLKRTSMWTQPPNLDGCHNDVWPMNDCRTSMFYCYCCSCFASQMTVCVHVALVFYYCWRIDHMFIFRIFD